jgi:hypothetical protein
VLISSVVPDLMMKGNQDKNGSLLRRKSLLQVSAYHTSQGPSLPQLSPSPPANYGI